MSSRDDADAASMGFRNSGEVSEWQRTQQKRPAMTSTDTQGISDEQIDAIGTQFYGTCYTPADRAFAKAVLAIQRGHSGGVNKMVPEAAQSVAAEEGDRLIALAEKRSAEVGRYEGDVVWVKFHSRSSFEAFATGVVMSAVVRRHRHAAQGQAGKETCNG